MSMDHPAEGHTDSTASLPMNTCFGCGKDNAEGMGLVFRFEGELAVCDFHLDKRYQGPPGHCHGGIIATILDEAMGKMNKLRQVVALTKTMTIDYLRPVPLQTDLQAVGWEETVEGRVHTNAAEIRNMKGEVLARGRGVFIAIDPLKKFAAHLPEMAR